MLATEAFAIGAVEVVPHLGTLCGFGSERRLVPGLEISFHRGGRILAVRFETPAELAAFKAEIAVLDWPEETVEETTAPEKEGGEDTR